MNDVPRPQPAGARHNLSVTQTRSLASAARPATGPAPGPGRPGPGGSVPEDQAGLTRSRASAFDRLQYRSVYSLSYSSHLGQSKTRTARRSERKVARGHGRCRRRRLRVGGKPAPRAAATARRVADHTRRSRAPARAGRARAPPARTTWRAGGRRRRGRRAVDKNRWRHGSRGPHAERGELGRLDLRAHGERPASVVCGCQICALDGQHEQHEPTRAERLLQLEREPRVAVRDVLLPARGRRDGAQSGRSSGARERHGDGSGARDAMSDRAARAPNASTQSAEPGAVRLVQLGGTGRATGCAAMAAGGRVAGDRRSSAPGREREQYSMQRRDRL
jgi:hypothetical protein